MTTFKQFKQSVITGALGAILVSIVSNGAFARTVNISGNHSASEIKATCDNNGGQYVSSGVNFGYACIGAGDGGSVVCEKNGKCRGYVPRRGAIGAIGGSGGVMKPPATVTRAPLQAKTLYQSSGASAISGRHHR
jgi:hypothetical protein